MSILFLRIDSSTLIDMHEHLSFDFKISSEIYIVVCWLKVSLIRCNVSLIFIIFFSYFRGHYDRYLRRINRLSVYMSACCVYDKHVCLYVRESVISNFGINSQAPSLYG